MQRPGAEIDRLIEEASSQSLASENLEVVLAHIARVGFSDAARERVRGRLAGMVWQEKVLRGSDTLSPLVVHYLWHAVKRREWPTGTTLSNYDASLRQVVLDNDSGVLVGTYQGAVQLGVVREARDLRGPGGHEWVVVQYRSGWGYWVTGYQPVAGLADFFGPDWSGVTWLRQPRRSDEP